MLLDVNLVFHDMAFTRAGSYSGTACGQLTDAMAAASCQSNTPWAGQPYPTIHNQAGFAYQPFVAVTTDGGWFENWTFGLAVYSPPGIGKRQYGTARDVAVSYKNSSGNTVQTTTPRYETNLPQSDNGRSFTSPNQTSTAPAPSRYDIVATDFTILTPTLAAAYHAMKYLDLGLGVQWVVGEFNLLNANITNSGPTLCGANGDGPNCDSYGLVRTTVQTVGFLLSALIHPSDAIDIGLTYRPQIDLNSTGTIHPYPTVASPVPLADFPASFSIKLPHILRAGVRAVSRYSDRTERADIELDATYENWSVEDFARVRSDNFLLGGSDGKLVVDVPHHFNDTFSVRLGGAYNQRLGALSRLILRAGAYYDSPTADEKWTHLDTYTSEKVGVTLGLGIKHKGFTFNVAYAGIYMPNRTVNNDCTNTPSDCLRAGSATNGTRWEPADPTVFINNGRYESTMHIVSLGMTVDFDEFSSRSLAAN